jgi:hypothetical protein
MIKKLVVLLVMGILLISFMQVSFVIAQEDEATSDSVSEVVSDEVDEETRLEVEVMDSNHGRYMRLRQLYRSISRKIFRANLVIDYLKEKGVDTEGLGDIVSELEILRDEVKEIPDSESHEEAVKKFIDIKRESKKLIREFKDLSKELTDEDDRDEIRKRLQEAREDHLRRLKEIDDEVLKRRRLLHAAQAKKILDHLEVTDEDLLAKIESGEIKFDDIKSKLKGHYREKGESVRNRIHDKLKDDYREKKSISKRVLDHHKKNIRDRAVDRIKNRADILESKGHKRAGDHLRKAADHVKYGRKDRLKRDVHNKAVDKYKRKVKGNVKDKITDKVQDRKLNDEGVQDE